MNRLKQKYFEIWADEESQNLILKWLLVFSLLVIAMQTAALVTLSLRKPILFGIGDETKMLTFTPPKSELLRRELERTIVAYVEAHYNWDPTSIEKAHQVASRYVAENFRKAFLAANSEQVKLAKERKVSQRVYPTGSTAIDLDKKIASVSVDRIFSVEGIRATAPLTLEVGFAYGGRTSENPEGIYITSERLVTSEK
jgi:hypothetical protein